MNDTEPLVSECGLELRRPRRALTPQLRSADSLNCRSGRADSGLNLNFTSKHTMGPYNILGIERQRWTRYFELELIVERTDVRACLTGKQQAIPSRAGGITRSEATHRLPLVAW
jgi:hypothetical protein